MSDLIPVLFLVQKIGPYHHARLTAWARQSREAISVIEFRPDDAVYQWATVQENGGYKRVQTHSRKELFRTLDKLKPQLLVCVGYFDPEIHQAMSWALRRQTPLVICSDSTYEDEPRRFMKEAIKRQIVAAFDAGLVAGGRADEYLEHLGMNSERRFSPWDVVGNSHFERGADWSREHERALREKLRLPVHYFLCVARFIPKKNLIALIKAYASYLRNAGKNAWSLVLSGDGPLEFELRASVAVAGLNEHVYFPGFLHYSDLPSYYGLASAFVLPSVSDQWGLVVNEAMAAGLPLLVSSRCGCAPNLVREGENGFVFAPDNIPELSSRMTEIANLPLALRVAMGKRSREIVKAFSPEAFALGLKAAIACALNLRRRRVSWLTRLIVSLLATRSSPNS